MSKIFLTGATGFVGKHVLGALREHEVTVLIRSNPRSDLPATQVVGDVTRPESLSGLLDGHDVVIHLVGIIEESKGATFDNLIRCGTENILTEAKRAGAKRFVYVSALGARDSDKLPYMQAKFRSEKLLEEAGLEYTILRPSVIFGPGDGFINALADVVRSFPITPVVGDGKTKFQPVSVFDVADAIANLVGDRDLAKNQTLALGGGEQFTYEEMIDLIAAELGKKHPKFHVPVPLMKAVLKSSSFLPRSIRPPVTIEQLKMLSLDNSTSPEPLAGLIGRQPRSLRGNIEYIRDRR